MKTLFIFDTTLRELMNLREQSKSFSRLRTLFHLLDHFWYDVSSDRLVSEKRRNRIRIGSVKVFLDDDGALHLDFCTRFSFNNNPEAVKLLEKAAELTGDEDEMTAYTKITQ